MDAETKTLIESDGDSRAVLYDAVGEIWLNFYGEDVHLGACRLCCGKRTVKAVELGACSRHTVLLVQVAVLRVPSAPGPPAAVPEGSVQGALSICLLLMCVLHPRWLHRALFRPQL